jgi:hypothetical protein
MRPAGGAAAAAAAPTAADTPTSGADGEWPLEQLSLVYGVPTNVDAKHVRYGFGDGVAVAMQCLSRPLSPHLLH